MRPAAGSIVTVMVGKTGWLVAWSMLNLLALVYALKWAFPMANGTGGVDYPAASQALRLVMSGLPAAMNGNCVLTCGVVLSVLAAPLLGWAIAWGESRFGLSNRTADARQALVWGCREFILSGLFLLALLPFLTQVPQIEMVAMALSIVAFPVMGLAILSRQFLDLERHAPGLRISWPGWNVMSSALALCLIGGLIEVLLVNLSVVHWVAALGLATLDTLLFGPFLSALMISVLVYRIPWGGLEREFRRRLDTRFFASWLLLHANLLLWFLWLIWPLLTLALINVFVIPSVVETASMSSAGRSAWLNAYLAASDAFVSHWWLGALLFWGLGLMITGRYLVIVDREAGYRGGESGVAD